MSNNFKFSTDISSAETLTIDTPRSVWEVLGSGDTSILATYGGDLHFDNYNVELLTQRGSDNGVTIKYGKNMTALEAKGNAEGDYNGVVAFWYKEPNLVTGSVKYLSGAAEPYNVKVLDCSSMFDTQPSTSQLNTAATAELANIAGITSSITVSFVPLWQSDEYAGLAPVERVKLGDTVSVIYDEFGIAVKTRVNKTVYNVLTDRYDSIELGAVQETLADSIANGGGGGGTRVTNIFQTGVTSVNGNTGAVTIPYAIGTETGGSAVRTAAIPYGEVDNTSTSTAFTATVPGIKALTDGTCVMLKNGVVTSASGFTLNVNNLGALPVYTNLAAATRDTTIFNVAYTMLFVYDSGRVEGGCWVCYRGYDANTIGYQVRTNSSALPASDKFYRYRLLFTSADGTKYVPANTSSSTNATAIRTTNTRPIDPFGEIRYYSATTAIEAGAKPGVAVIWQQYTLTLGYSFNNAGAALTLSVDKPVYLRCAPQTDGSAVMEYFTQTRPTSEDGKIYIFLGIAYSATAIELSMLHPVYYYKNGGLRLWTGV